MKLVIGLVGEKGSGKQTFVNFFKEIATSPSAPQNDIVVRQVRFSDILAQTLLLWDIPITRSNLQQLSLSMDKTFGSKSLAHAARFNVANEDADVVIFDGIRGKEQFKMIKAYPKSLIIYVTAEQNLRYQRLNKRSEKVGEAGLSYEQFMQEEKVKTETQVPKIGKKADFKIENNGTLNEFKAKIKAFMSSIK